MIVAIYKRRDWEPILDMAKLGQYNYIILYIYGQQFSQKDNQELVTTTTMELLYALAYLTISVHGLFLMLYVPKWIINNI